MACRTRLKGLVIAAAAMAALVACADWSQLGFRQDQRLQFTSPQSHRLVELPLTLSWSMDDFRIVKRGSAPPDPAAGYFAVFVDTAPMKPAQTMRDLMADDPACTGDPKCPDKADLADRGIYTTTKTKLVLRAVAPLSPDEPVELHDVTVVLLDSEGRRIGESAWNIQFKLENRTIS